MKSISFHGSNIQECSLGLVEVFPMQIKNWVKRFARIAGWAIIGVCLPWGIWWYFHIPTPGKAGLLLAVVATVMPLVWDDVLAPGRAGLIFVVVVLSAVEFRAIDKDRRDYAEEQGIARKEERESFKKLLDTQTGNAQRILRQEDEHFTNTLKGFLNEDKRENARFYALLGKQENLFKRQEELSESLNGKLIPGNFPTPANNCGAIPSKAVALFVGTNVTITDIFPHIVLFSLKMGPVLTIDRSDNSMSILLDIKTRDGKIITRMDRDGYVVNRNEDLQIKRPDKSTLIVIDVYGLEVLKARFLNPRALQLTGAIRYPGSDQPLPLQ
jgi:hypothetical protein